MKSLKFLACITLSSIMFSCSKPKDELNIDDNFEFFNVSKDNIMNPGPDPEFDNYYYSPSSSFLKYSLTPTLTSTWERFMYIDKTDTIYKSSTSTKKLAKYLKTYGFTGVYMYSTSGIVSSTSNYSSFATFIKTLSDSGITYKAVASGSATTFQSTGNITRYNNSQTDINKKINRANLELEWWNGACNWQTWDSTLSQSSRGTILDNDFYEGWYKNMGSTIDTIASKDQVKFSDRILLHCYQNGIPTYSYANAKSTGATGGRLDIIAKGAKQMNKKIDLYIIISSENTAWGASNTFTGPALAAASSQLNPYEYIEIQAYNNIFGNMTTFQKDWINFKGFVWFTKRYCYAAIPPK